MERDRHKILSSLMKGRKNWNMAELGVMRGRTTKYMLINHKNLIEYWAIDLWDGDKGPRKKQFARKFGAHWHESLYLRCCKLKLRFPGRLNVVKASSLEASRLFKPKYFDLVFIDADHSYEAVLADIKAWEPLVKKGGFLTGHDYGSRRHVGVTKAVDECFDDIELLGGAVWVRRI